MRKIFIVAGFFFAFAFAFDQTSQAQSKAKKPVKKTTAKKTQSSKAETAQPIVAPDEITTQNPNAAPLKRNERPGQTTSDAAEPQKKNQSAHDGGAQSSSQSNEPENFYFYEFSQPNFLVKHLIIEHDETGKGKIVIEKKDFAEPETDPLQLSAATLEKLNQLFQTLNFLDSTEVYQSAMRDYGHLGNSKIKRKIKERERVVEFNWSENKDAKALADEYRRIGQQAVWIFDINVARANYPLDAPGLMDQLDSLLRRNEIADPVQLVPVLKKLTDDEKIPLIARNHAARIVKDIEKKNSK